MVALNIPIGQWHTVRALESGTVIMEVRNGPYEPTGGGRYTGFVIGLIGCDLGIGLPPVAGRQVPSDAECGGTRDCGTHPSAPNEG